jgi:DNA-binding CsgD family transcriptional regulator
MAAPGCWARERLRSLFGAVEATLDCVGEPIIVLRADGAIEHANREAEALVALGPIATTAMRRLRRIGGLVEPGLPALLASAAAGAAREARTWFAAGAGLRTMTVRASPIPRDSAIALRWPRASVLLIVEVDDPVAAREARLRELAARRTLTRTEVAVLRRLAEGQPPADIADALGVRLSTVRTHVRNLLAKCGLRRTVDLVSLLAGAAWSGP